VLLAKTLRSSTLKLALISIGVFGIAVCVLFGYVYWSTASYVLSRSDRAIAAEQAELQQVYQSGGRDGLVAAIGQRLSEKRFEGHLYLLTDPEFTPLAGNLSAWPRALQDASGWQSISARDWSSDPTHSTMLRAALQTLPDGSHLLIGGDIQDLDRFANSIYAALAWSVALIFALAAIASVFVTRRTVGRIESINATSRAIMQSGPTTRIPLRGSHDEWDQLAENLNAMLDRIESLMSEVKQVTDNVAHDLRTPLARMRGRLEKAGNRPRDADADQSLINEIMADLDGVLRMFASLTRISQIETSDRTAAFRTVNLADIAREVVELFDAAAEDKGCRLRVVGDRRILVTGDRDLLFDALANLVDNAIKHGGSQCEVIVTATGGEGVANISVADNGPGIPASEFQHVFKRFYRLERSRRMPGNGLGLSLVAAVAQLHGARIEMRDNVPGLELRLQFPLAPETAVENGNGRTVYGPQQGKV
jgi:signal transduction histidine kinase